jgi:hypothetical protein
VSQPTPTLSLVESRIIAGLEHLALARLPQTSPELVEAAVHINFAEIQFRRALMTASELLPPSGARRLMDNVTLKGVPEAEPVKLTFHRMEKHA